MDLEKLPKGNKVLKVVGNTPEVVNGSEYKNVNHIFFEGEEYIVSHKAVFTLNATEKCNARCKFCFNGITFMTDGKYTKPEDDSLKRNIAFCKLSGIKTIAYSGGEPTLNPQGLYNLVSSTVNDFNEGLLHTNGIGLFSEVKTENEGKKQLIDALCEKDLFGCTISLAHYDQQKNSKIMDFQGKFKGLTDDQLKKLSSMRSESFSPRLSCFMAPGGIDNFKEITKYLEYGISLGFNNFIFRAGSGIPGEFAKTTKFTDVNASAFIDIDEMSKEMAESGYKDIFSLHKSDAHLHVMKLGNVTVILDMSSEEEDPDQKIRRVIHMTNGVAYKSWIDPSQLLFDSDINEIIENVLVDTNDRNKTSNYPASEVSDDVRGRIKTLAGKRSVHSDLHVHTANSDGLKTSREVIREALRKELPSLTFAEHNFLSDDYEIIKKEAAVLGIDIPFPGVEVSTVFRNEDGQSERKYHVLAYGNALLDPEFQEYIYLPLEIKNDYFSDLIEGLRNRHGFNLPPFDDLLKGIQGDNTYLHPYKKQMTRTIIASKINELTDMPIDEIKEKYIPQISQEMAYGNYLDTTEVIQRVRDLGGVAGLAHPGWDRVLPGHRTDIKRGFEIIYFLRKKGMQGLETFSGHHIAKNDESYFKFAKETGLFVIGGSDYHGKGKYELGQYGVTEGELDRIKNILAKTNNL